MLVAIAHIIGASLVGLALGMLTETLAEWEKKRNSKITIESAALKLGVPVSELNNEALAPKLIQYFSERFSDEVLVNRIADLCGVVKVIWGWLGSITQIGIFFWVIYIVITDGPGDAPLIWLTIPIWLTFWIVSVIFSYACRVLTGRFPGQPKAARKELVKARENAHSPEGIYPSVP